MLATAVGLTLRPSPADAQLDTFVRAVHELAAAAGQPEPRRSLDTRIAAHRIGAALVEWDRHLHALEVSVDREIPGASAQRAYRLRLELGVAYRARGRISDALREFAAAIALQPSSSDLRVLQALTLEVANRPKEAGEAFRSAWSLDARDPIKAYYVAQRAGGSPAERGRALAVLTDAYRHFELDAAPPAGSPFVTLDVIPDTLSATPIVADHASVDGFARLRAGQFGDAVAALERGDVQNDRREDSPLVHLAQGRRDEAQNRVAAARREYQAALAGTLVGRSVLLVGLARLAQVEGDLAGAVDAFAQAIRLRPNDPNLHQEFAGAYLAQGRADDAFCELMAALLINRRDAPAHAAIGRLYLDTGRDAEAVAAFDRALALMPERYEIRYALATAHTRLGNASEAARQLEIFDRGRREALEQRRRDIANEVEQEEGLRGGLPAQGDRR